MPSASPIALPPKNLARSNWRRLMETWPSPKRPREASFPPVLLAFDEKPSQQVPRMPQKRAVILNGHDVTLDVAFDGDAIYRIKANVVGNACVIGTARIISRHNAVRLADLWVDTDFRRNGLGRYLIELSGELFPNIEWADTEPAKPFYNALLNRQLIKKIKWGKHPLAQARYAMAGNEITTKRRRA